jgi:peptidoglycan/LPS O-acetylase OafA/YrhL
VSNLSSPFVDMVGGAQGTAVKERNHSMSTVTSTSPDVTVGRARSRLAKTLPRATVSVGVLAAAVTTAAAAALRGGGAPLAVHGRIALASFAQITFVAAVIGGVLVALLNRRSCAPRQRFFQVTIGLTVLSLLVPAAFADTGASKIALVGLHLIAAAIIVPVLAGHAD